MNKKFDYEPQFDDRELPLTYVLALDHGSADIVKAIYIAICNKNLNEIHPRKEMEALPATYGFNTSLMVKRGKMTSNMVGNLSRPRFHGLIASIDDKPGYYCITNKGMNFLKKKPVYKFAIVSKVEHMQIGYHVPFEDEYFYTDVDKLTKKGEYWEKADRVIVGNKMLLEGQLF